ncbi:MAG: hypothetical protein ND807_08370 [Vicinamibacterales bacterium]|nr:hypothetical protein [Vicinamibacterales bacterium]
MLKALCAIVLVALTVSPFTAPFQTLGSGDDLGSQIAPLEFLSALREDTGTLGVLRAEGPGRPTLAPVFGATAQMSNAFSLGAGSIAQQWEMTNRTGVELIRSTVLRL